jgi:tRNA modification GTPase
MYIRNEDTICAPATVPGTGAISVIRVSGPEALTVADKVIRCRKGNISTAKGYSLKFGLIYNNIINYPSADCSTLPKEEIIDEVLVSIFKAPHSYTGENSVEISCHASSYIVSSIMNLLYQAGARAAEPGEFTQRAFLNGKMDLTQAEAVADVIASQNAAAHRIAFKQMKGGFSSELKGMRNELLELASLMELELDFSEEEVEFADRTRLDSLLEKIISHVGRLIDSFRLGNAIKNGVPVAIAGATNTGKSTLLNALLGEDRAIVSDVHGTTRDTIEETLNIDGILFRFIDTAGLRETSETVEKIGIERTFKKISEASIVLGMIDLTRDFDSTCETIRKIVDKVNLTSQKLVFLLNKIDIVDVNKNVNIYNYIVSCFNNKGFKSIAEPIDVNDIKIIEISAKLGTGIDELRNILAETQKNVLADSDTTLVTNQRHVQALTDARTSLLRVREGLATGLPTDLAADDLRLAIYSLSSIIGEISSQDVLINIFSSFCIGK